MCELTIWVVILTLQLQAVRVKMSSVIVIQGRIVSRLSILLCLCRVLVCRKLVFFDVVARFPILISRPS